MTRLEQELRALGATVLRPAEPIERLRARNRRSRRRLVAGAVTLFVVAGGVVAALALPNGQRHRSEVIATNPDKSRGTDSPSVFLVPRTVPSEFRLVQVRGGGRRGAPVDGPAGRGGSYEWKRE